VARLTNVVDFLVQNLIGFGKFLVGVVIPMLAVVCAMVHYWRTTFWWLVENSKVYSGGNEFGDENEDDDLLLLNRGWEEHFQSCYCFHRRCHVSWSCPVSDQILHRLC
jgi:hypothetical protein